MVVELPELTEVLNELREIKERITCLESAQELPEWLDLRTAAKLKGIPYDSMKDRRALWPSNGEKIGGVRRFRREDVLDWLGKNDLELGCRPAPKYTRLRIRAGLRPDNSRTSVSCIPTAVAASWSMASQQPKRPSVSEQPVKGQSENPASFL